MDKVETLIAKFEGFADALTVITADVLKQNDNLVLDLQTAQLEAGIDSENRKIEPPYTPMTVRIKLAKGQPFNRVTLKDTGDFHDAMFLAGGSKGFFQIGNRDEKLNKLEAKYGKDILGLTDASKQEIIDDLLRFELPERAKMYFEK